MVTVICTTCMSLGLSGVSLNMNSKISLVPYLVAFISLENILAITQSVISTPGHLDVKIRIGKHSVEISEFFYHSVRFYVKSIYGILEVQNLPF